MRAGQAESPLAHPTSIPCWPIATDLHTCTPIVSCYFSNIIVLTLHLTHRASRLTHPSTGTGNRRSPPRRRRRMEDEYGRAAAGLALRAADAEEEPRLRDHQRADTGARHRSESRDLY